MEKITIYNDGTDYLDVNSLITTDLFIIDIKDLFILNDITYISYNNDKDVSLKIESVSSFIESNRPFLGSITKKPIITNETDCHCENCNKQI